MTSSKKTSWKKLKITPSLMPVFFRLQGNTTQNGFLLSIIYANNLCQQLPLQWFSLCDSHSQETTCSWWLTFEHQAGWPGWLG